MNTHEEGNEMSDMVKRSDRDEKRKLETTEFQHFQTLLPFLTTSLW
jgi:hypothetical protein